MHNDSREPSEGAAQVVSRAISAAKKRAEYKRLGLEWPKYPDGTDQLWVKSPRLQAGGHWRTWPKTIRQRSSDRRRNTLLRAEPGICAARGCTRPKHKNLMGAYEPSCSLHKNIRRSLYKAKTRYARATKRAEEINA